MTLFIDMVASNVYIMDQSFGFYDIDQLLFAIVLYNWHHLASVVGRRKKITSLH